MKTGVLSWLQIDGSRGFSVDQLKRKQLSPTFRPDAPVVIRAKDLKTTGRLPLPLKMSGASSRNSVKVVVSFKLVYRELSTSIILEPAENCSLHKI